MKKYLIALSMFLAVVCTTNSAQAQITGLTGDITTALQGGLVNVNVQDVIDNITIGDVEIITLDNVLNNNDVTVDVRALNNFLNGFTIDNVLNNLLRDANLITDNQIVVGVLSGAIIVADKKQVRTKK
jgi:hypothetical protein